MTSDLNLQSHIKMVPKWFWRVDPTLQNSLVFWFWSASCDLKKTRIRFWIWIRCY